MMKHIINSVLLLSLSMFIIPIACKSPAVKEKNSYGDECRHCHGKELQGIHNVKKYCGQCHDELTLRPDQIKLQERKDGVFNGIHDHKTDNVFKSTPSCFFCHRRNDF